MQPVRVPLENQRIGLLVLEVHPGSVAVTAGLLIGDIVIGINGQLLRTAFDLTQVLQHAETLELNILRGGQLIACHVSFNSDATEVA
ncbi:PDZ domain-containing protein [Gloeocapsa sp. BRSZ]